MLGWNTFVISSFLKEREDRYKPDEANRLGLKRVEKIDFSGKIHIVDDKETKTAMIRVKTGDLLISGINIEKGAVSVYTGDEDVLATIHYSSYKFDESIIDIEYFKWFLRSREFKDVVNSQVRGGIKTELKPKSFLPLKIKLPSLEIQKSIGKNIAKEIKTVETVQSLVYADRQLVSKLRYSILQEAVRGVLVQQEPNDEPASDFIKKIIAEKEKLKKEYKIRNETQLPPITREEIPYELPKGWEWVRLGTIAIIGTGATPLTTSREYYGGSIPWITSSATNTDFILNAEKYITERAITETNCKLYPKNTLIVAMYGQGKTRGQVSELMIEATTNQACAAIVMDGTAGLYRDFVKIFFKKYYNEIRELAEGGAQPNLNLYKIKATLIPLPPLKEKVRIISKVNKINELNNKLETMVKENSDNSELLIEAVLREAFEAN